MAAHIIALLREDLSVRLNQWFLIALRFVGIYVILEGINVIQGWLVAKSVRYKKGSSAKEEISYILILAKKYVALE